MRFMKSVAEMADEWTTPAPPPIHTARKQEPLPFIQDHTDHFFQLYKVMTSLAAQQLATGFPTITVQWTKCLRTCTHTYSHRRAYRKLLWSRTGFILQLHLYISNMHLEKNMEPAPGCSLLCVTWFLWQNSFSHRQKQDAMTLKNFAKLYETVFYCRNLFIPSCGQFGLPKTATQMLQSFFYHSVINFKDTSLSVLFLYLSLPPPTHHLCSVPTGVFSWLVRCRRHICLSIKYHSPVVVWVISKLVNTRYVSTLPKAPHPCPLTLKRKFQEPNLSEK